MSLFGQYEIIKNENNILTCKDENGMYYIEINKQNFIDDASIEIKQKANAIIMPYYEYSLAKLCKEFPLYNNIEIIKCIIHLLCKKIEILKKRRRNKEMIFATTNIFITEKLEIKILPISVEHNIDHISTFFTNKIGIIALELLLHENTEKNILLKHSLYNQILEPEIKEIVGDDFFVIIEKLYKDEISHDFKIDMTEFKSFFEKHIFKKTKDSEQKDITDAKNITRVDTNITAIKDSNSNITNIKGEDKIDKKIPVSNTAKIPTDQLEMMEITKAETYKNDNEIKDNKKTEIHTTNREVLNGRNPFKTSINKNLKNIQNINHKTVISIDKNTNYLKNEIKPLSTIAKLKSEIEMKKDDFLKTKNRHINIFDKVNMNNMRSIIKKLKLMILYLKIDSKKYKNEIERLENELRELGINFDEELCILRETL